MGGLKVSTSSLFPHGTYLLLVVSGRRLSHLGGWQPVVGDVKFRVDLPRQTISASAISPDDLHADPPSHEFGNITDTAHRKNASTDPLHMS